MVGVPEFQLRLEVLGIGDLIVHEQPSEELPTMVVAFAGWPYASDSATGAVRHLVDNLPGATARTT